MLVTFAEVDDTIDVDEEADSVAVMGVLFGTDDFLAVAVFIVGGCANKFDGSNSFKS